MTDWWMIINPLNEEAIRKASARQDQLVKPPHSLGKLEDISVRMAGITGRVFSPVERRRVLVFVSDNGICEEGVASAPQSVTRSQAVNMTKGLTGAAVLAKHFRTELDVVDVGIRSEYDCSGIRKLSIAHGTRNFAAEPAMTREECRLALKLGAEAALRADRDGMDIIGIGEMGIGNTTTSSAVLSALQGLPSSETVSRGGGIDDAAFCKKKRVIDEAIARYQPDPGDPLDVLSKVGGFDLAAMCGAFLGAAALRLPTVIDGFISAVAALCAYRLHPLSRDYLFASHASMEKGYRLAMAELGLSPMLKLDMRLGEGSGCPPAFELIAAAETVIRDMATFEEAGIDDAYLQEIRTNESFQH